MVEDFNNFNNMSPAEMKKKAMDMMPINFRAGLYGGTPLLIDSTIKNIESVMFELKTSADIAGRIQEGWPTFGTTESGQPINTKIYPFPADVYADALSELHFNTGFTMECLPNSLIKTERGFSRASELLDEIKNGKPVDKRTKVSAWVADPEVGIKKLEDGVFVDSGDTVIQSVQTKVYLSKTDCGNILLPYFLPEDKKIIFICIMQ